MRRKNRQVNCTIKKQTAGLKILRLRKVVFIILIMTAMILLISIIMSFGSVSIEAGKLHVLSSYTDLALYHRARLTAICRHITVLISCLHCLFLLLSIDADLVAVRLCLGVKIYEAHTCSFGQRVDVLGFISSLASKLLEGQHFTIISMQSSFEFWLKQARQFRKKHWARSVRITDDLMELYWFLDCLADVWHGMWPLSTPSHRRLFQYLNVS
jgi:hypothetical protein